MIDRYLFETPGDCRPRPHENCYWLLPDRLLAGEHPWPFSADVERIRRIDALLDAGMRRFVDLTEEQERPPYEATLVDRSRSRGLPVVYQRFAIRDFGVPDVALMRSILDAIYRGIDAGETIYIHCWGGIGRTGTVVGCLLREQGLTPSEALDVIARKWLTMEKRFRHPRSPEWPEQYAFIERWLPAIEPSDKRT